jgi:RES domain-containing protein
VTPIEKVLDRTLLTERTPLPLYRLAAGKYATNLSGIGAAKSPGRWNFGGQEAIYTSLNVSTCVLERLAHTPKDRIPTDLNLMTLHFSGTWLWREPQGIAEEENTAAKWAAYTTLKSAYEEWPVTAAVEYKELVVLAVPSVIVPEWNVVLYPQAKGFWDHVRLVSAEPFSYDERLFPSQPEERSSQP